jgi:hypothetical protein
MLIIVGPEHRPRIRGKIIDACIHDQGRGAALKKYPEFMRRSMAITCVQTLLPHWLRCG